LEPAPAKSKIATVIRLTGGNFLEMYDFFLFGLYAPYIARTFFSFRGEFAGLLLTFMMFGAGFLMRPLGAVLLGGYMDRVGRRKGLLVTLSIMATGTVLIAAVPGYATIGPLAPALVLIGRLLQGFSAGSEQGGVSVYLSEMATPGHKGFYVAWQSSTAQASIMIAALIGYLLSRVLSPADLAAWGWRIPFVLGCMIVPVLLMLRRTLQETEAFLQRAYRPSIREIVVSLAQNWRIVGLGVLLVATTTVQFYAITIYTPTFGKTVLKLSDGEGLAVTFCVALANLVWVPIAGAVSDWIGRKPVLLTFSALTILTAYPALSWLIAHPTFGNMMIVLLWLSIIYAGYTGAMIVALIEIIPIAVRTSGFSLAYTLATAAFGGFTPLISTWLVDATGNKASVGLWMAAAGGFGLLATITFYRKGGAATADAQRLPVARA
jgi:MHS family citrate/tricarballylate:H+ symporter-like MFS transporter